jgi:hypothetical protein
VPTAAQLDAHVLAQPALPKARQWTEWLAYNAATMLPNAGGWQAGVRDTLLHLHHAIAVAARRLRRNPTWDFQGTMTDDTEPLEASAQTALATFDAINPKDIPERFTRLMWCIRGALRQQIRLAREIDTMRRAGKLEVDVFVDEANRTAVEK